MSSDAFYLVSPAFPSEKAVHSKYKEGEVVCPPLRWENVPDNTTSLALLVDEHFPPIASAPKKNSRHWALYNMPPSVRDLPEDVTNQLTKGILESFNFYQINLTGGTPPAAKEHRYKFKLYALDTMLPNLGQQLDNKEKFLAAMRGHVLSEAELNGAFQVH